MHRYDHTTDALADEIVQYSLHRVRLDPPPLDRSLSPAELHDLVGDTITEAGLGGSEVLRRFAEHLAPATISIDHPRYLAFIPSAPTEAAVLFDLVVGASSIYGGSWLEGAGAVYAENQALRWIADLAGLPASAGGSFVQGGSIGNLSALVTARDRAIHEWTEAHGDASPPRWSVMACTTTHSSMTAAAKVMGIDVIEVQADPEGRLGADALRHRIHRLDPLTRAGLFAVAATAGTTNLGIVDRLAEVASVCSEEQLWMHVDGAYGGAGLAAPSVRERFDGIEHADSFIVDPHKWLFAPFDCCALLYRDPALARRAHAQHAGYLDVLTGDHDSPTADVEWNPSDYSYGLSRRARGLPFWFSLATHGTAAYTTAVETTLAVAQKIAQVITADPRLELIRAPDLSVVAFRRRGWTRPDYDTWSARLLRDQIGFVTPSTHDGDPILRFAIVNPLTTVDDLTAILATL